MKTVKHPFDAAVVAQTHPSLYLMHKYWARKPHNVVARYIDYYTNPGDVVLDPFVGSGVTVIEAARQRRKPIGVDLNPMACFITRMTLLPVALDKLDAAFARVQDAVQRKIIGYYEVQCSKCAKRAISTSVVWKQSRFDGAKLYLLKVACPHCKAVEKRRPTDDDLARIASISNEAIPFFSPKQVPLHETAKRSVEYIHELFVHRALICLSILLDAIQKEKDQLQRNMLLFCFSSNLAQMANLNSIDMRKGREFSSRGWVIPNYWVPSGFLETNVWNGFAARYSKVKRGKTEAAEFCKSSDDFKVIHGDATNLNQIPSGSVDYIFTDPPYGDAVPYFGLSLMWASWLGWENQLDFDHEIIVSERGDYEQELAGYQRMLKESFREMFRVLKNNGTVTVTFHNTKIRVWNALVSSAFEAGLIYENDNYVIPAVKSSKSQLAISGSMTGDIYINFRKPAKGRRQQKLTTTDITRMISEEARMIIQSRNGQATTDQLARGIYSHLIKENLFTHFPDTDIRKLLSTLPIEEVMPNVWTIPNPDDEMLLAYIPLTKRIEFIVDSVLESKARHGFELDDFLVPIFTQLKNGLTPGNKEIIEVLRQRAHVKGDKWYPHLEKQLDWLSDEKEIPTAVDDVEILREHEQFIYQLARLGSRLGFNIWVGTNEQNKSDVLQKLSIRRLEIPGLTEKFIAKNRLNQIDLIWLKPDEGSYVAFEIENSTGVVPGIQRLANLTQAFKHINIPTYVVIPDKLRRTAQNIFDSPSGMKLGDAHRQVIVYSKLLHHIDLLGKGIIRADDLLCSIAEPA